MKTYIDASCCCSNWFLIFYSVTRIYNPSSIIDDHFDIRGQPTFSTPEIYFDGKNFFSRWLFVRFSHVLSRIIDKSILPFTWSSAVENRSSEILKRNTLSDVNRWRRSSCVRGEECHRWIAVAARRKTRKKKKKIQFWRTTNRELSFLYLLWISVLQGRGFSEKTLDLSAILLPIFFSLLSTIFSFYLAVLEAIFCGVKQLFELVILFAQDKKSKWHLPEVRMKSMGWDIRTLW